MGRKDEERIQRASGNVNKNIDSSSLSFLKCTLHLARVLELFKSNNNISTINNKNSFGPYLQGRTGKDRDRKI